MNQDKRNYPLFFRHFLVSLLILTFFTLPALSQYLESFEERMTEFRLDNGMKFLVLERHEAPVVSFHTYADVGSSDEVTGITGMAHLFEHMAFKGTKSIGTTDSKNESKALAAVDQAFEALKAEQEKITGPDPNTLKQLEEDFTRAQQIAGKYIVHDQFEEILTKEGASGLNAYTGADATRYISSLPSNKLELWMAMESDRFANPVLREFYKEKNVVMEERRLRTESNPQGKLLEEFLSVAFKAHPYGEPVIGHMSDIESITIDDAKKFYTKYYTPSNLTAVIVGDVDPKQVEKLAEKYFAPVPSGPEPKRVETVEPPQVGERRIVVTDAAQPLLLIGFHRPALNHPDNAAFDVLEDIIGSGRTARLYKSLVKEKKIAVSASAFSGYPGEKYPNLFVFYAVPAKGHTNAECEQAINDEIEKIKTEFITADELKKAKTRARANVIRQLGSNSGLAGQLAYYQVLTGDWRNLFKELDEIELVRETDVWRIANECFVGQNMTVGMIETKTAQ